MTTLLESLTHKLAKQRSVSIFEKQEERIAQLNEEYGLEIKVAEIIRVGVDIALDQLEEKLKAESEG